MRLDNAQLAKYLNIALKQRERALAKFIQDYGPGSATVKECTTEIADLKIHIAELQSEKTELEKAIDKRK